MSWTIEYLAEKEMVLLVLTGDIVDEDCGPQVADGVRLLYQHECTRVLVDCSEAVPRTSLPNLYRLPDYATELKAPWNVRVAIVLPRAPFQTEKFEFLALVSRNAGYDVRLFDGRQSAEDWLRRPRLVRTGPPQLASA